MSKAFYSDFANHCLRFYTRHKDPVFHNEVDKRNWEVCEEVLSKYPDREREILTFVYYEGDTIADNVYKIALAKGVAQDSVWKLVNALEREIALQRGLI